MSRAGAPEHRLFLLLGDPVEHSLSPAMQNAAIEAEGLEASYGTLRVARPTLVEPVMRALAEAGGGGNVTVPHKEAAARALDHAGDRVTATGACNLFWGDRDGNLCGDNSDVQAFREAAEAVLDRSLGGTRVLVLGAGGAARAVVYSCLEAGAAQIDVRNRTRSRADRLAADLGRPSNLAVLDDVRDRVGASYDLIVNATSLGLRPEDPLPIEPAALATEAVLDLVYGSGDTELVQEARRRGMRAEDGRRMLVLQAAAAFRCWFDREPDMDAVYAAAGLAPGRAPS